MLKKDEFNFIGTLEDLQLRCTALSNAAARIADELVEAQRTYYRMTTKEE